MYEKLLREAACLGIDVYEWDMPQRIKGLYGDGVIIINKHVRSDVEKTCIMAEEMGHHHMTAGDILDQSSIANKKQEVKARRWAYSKLVPLQAIISAYQAGVRSRYELADYLGITEEFLEEAIRYYKQRYGISKTIGDYVVYFDPLSISETNSEY